MKIAVVVPTIRPESYEKFLSAWRNLFLKHRVSLVTVFDGEEPKASVREYVEDTETSVSTNYSLDMAMGEYKDLIFNLNDGVRNMGFAIAYKQLEADIIISLDDDTEPFGDTIQDHIDALLNRYPTSWMNTSEEIYMRGFPYMIRDQAECVLSHGVWNGVADFDASTQLIFGTPSLKYPKMPVPKGVLFPMCIMNVAMKRKAVPFMYQAPMGRFDFKENSKNINRFADIWAGIAAKQDIDKNDWCAVTGYAKVNHNRASNAFTNLIKEAEGVAMNELYGVGEYFDFFKMKRERWQQFLNS